MPELPEVQTIISDLNKKIKGAVITGFWSDWPKAIKNLSVDRFTKEIKGRKVLGARRIGKNIFIDLSGKPPCSDRSKKTLYIHLKMTGHLLVKPATNNLQPTTDNFFNDKVNQYVHHIWRIGKNKTLEFSDLRKFGKIVLDNTEKINNLPEIRKLGVDAMSKEFALNKFKKILNRRKNKSIGLVLMEQELISGIGNIYRSEILFEAGIAPARIIKKLSNKEIEKIYQAI